MRDVKLLRGSPPLHDQVAAEIPRDIAGGLVDRVSASLRKGHGGRGRGSTRIRCCVPSGSLGDGGILEFRRGRASPWWANPDGAQPGLKTIDRLADAYP